MSKAEEAVARFRDGSGCAQSIVSTYGKEVGLTQAAAEPPGGTETNPNAQVCGAVTGAFAVLERKHGGASANNGQPADLVHDLMREFTKRFQAANGSIICKNLTGADLGTPAAVDAARKQELQNARCAKYIRDAAEILEDILKDGEPADKALSVSAGILLDRLNNQPQAYSGNAAHSGPLLEA